MTSFKNPSSCSPPAGQAESPQPHDTFLTDRSHQPSRSSPHSSAPPSSYQLPLLPTAIPNSHLPSCCSTPLHSRLFSLLLWAVASANQPRFPNPSSSLSRPRGLPGNHPRINSVQRASASRTPAAAGCGLTPRTCSRSSPSSSDSHVRFLRRTFPPVVS